MNRKNFKYNFNKDIGDPELFFGIKIGDPLKLETINGEYIYLKYLGKSRIDGKTLFELIYCSSYNFGLIQCGYYNNIYILDDIEVVVNLEDHQDLRKFLNIKTNKDKLADIVFKYLNISESELESADITDIEREVKLLLLLKSENPPGAN